MTIDLDLKQLRYFVAVVDSGSFSAGARRAFVTQPTLSIAIARLEVSVGSKLLDRRPRGIGLTPAGREFLERARAILRDVETLPNAIRGSRAKRPVRIGVLPTLPPSLVVETLGRLAAFDPSMSATLEDAPDGVLIRRLASGRYDALLTALGEPAAGHRQHQFAQDALALAFERARRPRGVVTPHVLDGEPLIVRTHCEHLQAASRILETLGVRPRLIARTSSDQHALALVVAGVGACLMPDSHRVDRVVFVRPQGVDFVRRLGLEWIKGAADGVFDTFASNMT
jgi:DNA-binding transcriptional LysR family regulator